MNFLLFPVFYVGYNILGMKYFKMILRKNCNLLFSLSVGNSGIQGSSREHSESAGSEVRELQQKD